MKAISWQAGVARTPITPDEPMWLAGWAARRAPAAGAAMELWAKALALEDAAGERCVIVTADLIAVPRTLAEAVVARVQRRFPLGRERFLFNASHTHTGPELRPDKVPFFEIPPEFAAKIPRYLAQLEERLAALVTRALGEIAPATLRVRRTTAGFVANRRAAQGPVDHDVPVLSVHGDGGMLRAIVSGYACHNLTLPPEFCAYHGDYAGVAQQRLENTFPGATALFLAGAGADIDPAPRGGVEWSERHGATLADAVIGALAREAPAVGGTLCAALESVALDLQPLPSIEALQADLRGSDVPRRRKAEFLLAALAEQRPLATTQACPVQTLRLGDELLLIALGGEPVVDFSLRFKREFAGPLVWVAGYSNDLFGYVPTRRVQQEGGYEGGRAALWSAVPMPLAETSEARVTAALNRLVSATQSRPARRDC